ncbi:hypothetical protein D5S19_16335 [Amycolatopsis panacis]|uniref:Transposase n=1 Tax=Amycolatopsis panacis TaxID=2340917 RepID=A0A419I3F0_9PSEU|nr:hypothetical protein D5S19_16335 [Amycolatopsis panacis]
MRAGCGSAWSRRASATHCRDCPQSPGSSPIPVTLGEAKRLLAHLITTPVDRVVTWAWSHWRRRHQYRARQAHYQRRCTIDHEVLLEY